MLPSSLLSSACRWVCLLESSLGPFAATRHIHSLERAGLTLSLQSCCIQHHNMPWESLATLLVVQHHEFQQEQEALGESQNPARTKEPKPSPGASLAPGGTRTPGDPPACIPQCWSRGTSEGPGSVSPFPTLLFQVLEPLGGSQTPAGAVRRDLLSSPRNPPLGAPPPPQTSRLSSSAPRDKLHIHRPLLPASVLTRAVNRGCFAAG